MPRLSLLHARTDAARAADGKILGCRGEFGGPADLDCRIAHDEARVGAQYGEPGQRGSRRRAATRGERTARRRRGLGTPRRS